MRGIDGKFDKSNSKIWSVLNENDCLKKEELLDLLYLNKFDILIYGLGKIYVAGLPLMYV